MRGTEQGACEMPGWEVTKTSPKEGMNRGMCGKKKYVKKTRD